MANTIYGTPQTMAPERLFSDGTKMYDNKIDLWSIGFILFQMLEGDFPFFGLSPSELYWDIKEKEGKLKFAKCKSASMRQLINGLLKSDPAQRMMWADFISY